jgi:hypothetical protein
VNPLRIVVLGTVASNPYAGMAWMTMQIAAGLLRLGHDVHYLETTSAWPYDPVRQLKVDDSSYAAPYLSRVASGFGMGDRWGYRRTYQDGVWLGPSGPIGEELLASSDVVFNIAGATWPERDGLRVRNLVLFGTDPVLYEIRYASADDQVRQWIDGHVATVTYGENIGTSGCPVPPLPRLRARTRQPVLIDRWRDAPPPRNVYTSVGNWRQVGLDLDFRGDTYRWSKHHEFLRFLDLPRRVPQRIELAMNLGDRTAVDPAANEAVPALGLGRDGYELLTSHGWHLVDARPLTTEPWPYREYVRTSKAEFTVARDLNVRLRSGWFSERSACYLAAGRPVITQDTGFGTVLPTGEGLFAFQTMDDIVAAFDAIASDYERQSQTASAIAEEFFRAEVVLARLLSDLGL